MSAAGAERGLGLPPADEACPEILPPPETVLDGYAVSREPLGISTADEALLTAFPWGGSASRGWGRPRSGGDGRAAPLAPDRVRARTRRALRRAARSRALERYARGRGGRSGLLPGEPLAGKEGAVGGSGAPSAADLRRSAAALSRRPSDGAGEPRPQPATGPPPPPPPQAGRVWDDAAEPGSTGALALLDYARAAYAPALAKGQGRAGAAGWVAPTGPAGATLSPATPLGLQPGPASPPGPASRHPPWPADDAARAAGARGARAAADLLQALQAARDPAPVARAGALAALAGLLPPGATAGLAAEAASQAYRAAAGPSSGPPTRRLLSRARGDAATAVLVAAARAAAERDEDARAAAEALAALANGASTPARARAAASAALGQLLEAAPGAGVGDGDLDALADALGAPRPGGPGPSGAEAPGGAPRLGGPADSPALRHPSQAARDALAARVQAQLLRWSAGAAGPRLDARAAAGDGAAAAAELVADALDPARRAAPAEEAARAAATCAVVDWCLDGPLVAIGAAFGAEAAARSFDPLDRSLAASRRVAFATRVARRALGDAPDPRDAHAACARALAGRGPEAVPLAAALVQAGLLDPLLALRAEVGRVGRPAMGGDPFGVRPAASEDDPETGDDGGPKGDSVRLPLAVSRELTPSLWASLGATGPTSLEHAALWALLFGDLTSSGDGGGSGYDSSGASEEVRESAVARADEARGNEAGRGGEPRGGAAAHWYDARGAPPAPGALSRLVAPPRLAEALAGALDPHAWLKPPGRGAPGDEVEMLQRGAEEACRALDAATAGEQLAAAGHGLVDRLLEGAFGGWPGAGRRTDRHEAPGEDGAARRRGPEAPPSAQTAGPLAASSPGAAEAWLLACFGALSGLPGASAPLRFTLGAMAGSRAALEALPVTAAGDASVSPPLLAAARAALLAAAASAPAAVALGASRRLAADASALGRAGATRGAPGLAAAAEAVAEALGLATRGPPSGAGTEGGRSAPERALAMLEAWRADRSPSGRPGGTAGLPLASEGPGRGASRACAALLAGLRAGGALLDLDGVRRRGPGALAAAPGATRLAWLSSEAGLAGLRAARPAAADRWACLAAVCLGPGGDPAPSAPRDPRASLAPAARAGSWALARALLEAARGTRPASASPAGAPEARDGALLGAILAAGERHAADTVKLLAPSLGPGPEDALLERALALAERAVRGEAHREAEGGVAAGSATSPPARVLSPALLALLARAQPQRQRAAAERLVEALWALGEAGADGRKSAPLGPVALALDLLPPILPAIYQDRAWQVGMGGGPAGAAGAPGGFPRAPGAALPTGGGPPAAALASPRARLFAALVRLLPELGGSPLFAPALFLAQGLAEGGWPAWLRGEAGRRLREVGALKGARAVAGWALEGAGAADAGGGREAARRGAEAALAASLPEAKPGLLSLPASGGGRVLTDPWAETAGRDRPPAAALAAPLPPPLEGAVPRRKPRATISAP